MTVHAHAQQLIDWINGARYKSEKNGLGNMRALLAKLGNPETKFPCCHVAGTNGKGSVCAMTESVLRRAGYRTGLYTSPYLCEYNERICINGTPISDALLVECGEKVREAALALIEEGIRCTAFELGTALAFMVFEREHVDIAVIETGLGGRLDSTNVLAPVACAITAIGLDHTAVLGDTMEQIAYEKAGIIKENTPVAVYPERIPCVDAVFRETAKARNANLLPAETLPIEDVRFDERGCSFRFGALSLRVPLPGRHQAKNAATALGLIKLLAENGFPVSDEALAQGLARTKWHARLDWVRDTLLIDGAHNPHGAASLCEYVREFLAGRKIVLLTGMMRDKHPEECAKLLAGIADEVVATQVAWPRALPAEELAQLYRALGKDAKAVSEPVTALKEALSLAGENGLVLAAGSLYLAGDLLKTEEKVMYSFDDIRYVSLPLPEDICKAKWAGHFEEAKKLIRVRLADARLPEVLRARLRVEEGILERLPLEYPYTKEQALAKMREDIPDFTEKDLDEAEASGMVDVLYIEGEKHYIHSFADTLYNSVQAISDRAGKVAGSSAPILNEMIQRVREEGIVRRTLRLKASLKVTDEAFVKGETYTVHLPIPAKAPQVENIRLIAFSHEPKVIGKEDDPQRCVCFEETLEENTEFTAEYAYDIVVKRNMRYDAGIVTEEDLAEHAPHILFTPYMRALAQELSEGCGTDMEKAKAFYDFITTRTTYSFVRDYFLIDDAGEYVAKNRKGDCGLQALCFITLCRIAGIPARWQSGMSARPGDCGSHDWAMFYTKEGGWRLCDPSFGGSGFRAGDEVRRAFYFGNLEPYRMIANSKYYTPLSGEKRFPRNDPYDNQSGECEDTTHALSDREIAITRTVLDVQ